MDFLKSTKEEPLGRQGIESLMEASTPRPPGKSAPAYI